MTKFSLRYMCTQFMNMKLSKTKLELFRICDGAMVRVLGRNKGGIQSRLTQICELERVLRCTGTRTHTHHFNGCHVLLIYQGPRRSCRMHWEYVCHVHRQINWRLCIRVCTLTYACEHGCIDVHMCVTIETMITRGMRVV